MSVLQKFHGLIGRPLVSIFFALVLSSATVIGNTGLAAAANVNKPTTVSVDAPGTASLPVILPSAVTATVSTGSLPIPTGLVSFTDNGAPISGCTNLNLFLGKATCWITWTTPGLHTIQASYAGGSGPWFGDTYIWSASNGSDTTNVIDNRFDTTTTLTSNNNPAAAGSSITYTAVVPNTLVAFGGTISFSDGASTICAAVTPTLSAGTYKATCTTAATGAAGGHTITAAYSGNTLLKPSSTTLDQTVVYPITVTADNQNRPYGDANPDPLTFTVSNVQGDDNPFVTEPTCTTDATAADNAGTTHPITCSGGVTTPGYSIAGYVDGTLTIDPRDITLSVGDASGVYGSTPDLSGIETTAPEGSFAGDDTLASLGDITCTTTATASSPVNVYPITCTTGDETNPNYAVAFSEEAGVYTVTPAPLTISAQDASRIYGTANPTLSFSYNGFVNGDDETDLGSLPTCTTMAVTDSPVGSYAITCEGATSENYDITYVNGTLTVKPVVIVSVASTVASIIAAPAAAPAQATDTGTVLAAANEQGQTSSTSTKQDTPKHDTDDNDGISTWWWILLLIILIIIGYYLYKRRQENSGE